MSKVGVLIIITLYFLIQPPWVSTNKKAYCGRPIGTEFRLEERIVSGYDVGYYRYPWFAAFLTNGTVACGGALIAPKTILTAAHCYGEYIKNSKVDLRIIYNVSLGVYNVCHNENGRTNYFVTKVIIHEQYQKLMPYGDVALVSLNGNTDNYEPICLPKNPMRVRPRDGTVPGLGTLKYHGGTPCTVHEARLLIYPDSDCKNMINRTGNDPNKLFKAFCAGYLQGGIDTCQGDSGGPLQILDYKGNYVLLGVVSYGFECANPGLLGIYTDVSQYLDWIEEKMGPIRYNEDNEQDIATYQPHRQRESIYTPIEIIIFRNRKFTATKRKIKRIPIEIVHRNNKKMF